MEIGVTLPTVGPVAFREFILQVAKLADEAGLHSVWTSDHVVLPKDRGRSTYPFPNSEQGTWYFYEPGIDWLDPVAVMGFAAAGTERIAIGTSILVVPYRNPLVLANEMATIDRLSEGRAILGIGAGWLVEEFEALGVPSKARGRRSDEYVAAMRHLWSNDSPTSFEGEFVNFSDVQLATRPFTPGGPPIWVGGSSAATFKRVAKLGTGWIAFDLTPEEMAAGGATIRELAAEAGRGDAAFTMSVRVGIVPEGLSDFYPDRPGIRGSHEAMLDHMRTYAEHGTDLLMLDLGLPMDELIPTLEWLAEDAAPKVR